jgi:hypothetical protein
MISNNSGNATEALILNSDHETDEISSINEYFDTSFSLFSELPPIENRIPLDEEEFLNTLELAVNDCFKIKNENSMKQVKNSRKIFEVIRPEKIELFSKLEGDLFKEEENSLINRKRYKKKRSRRENQDNIRKKIKRGFFNSALIPKINMIIKKQGGKFFFEIFKQHFVSDVTKESNMELYNMTLEEIFKKKELYHQTELNTYYYNLKIFNSKEIQENKELKNILNIKLFKIFEEYINSKEFNIDEVNRLKNKNMEDLYIKRYIYLGKNFMKFINE